MAIDRESVLAAAQKYVEKKKYDKALIEYQKIIQVDPHDARTLLKMGDVQLKMDAYGEAVATYERVGRFYAAQGFALKAIAVFKQIREIIQKHVPHLDERYAHIAPKLAELYQQLGLTSDALAALDEHAVRLARQQRDGEAIDVFRRIVDLDPTNPLPHLRLAEALSRARDADGAATEFAVASAQLIKHGRRDDALKVIERLLHHRADPAQARIAAEMYLARNQSNDGMQALAKLQICFQSNPKDLDTLALLARAFVAIGQASKGIEVHKEMARIARDQGRNDLFQEIVAKLERMAPHDEQVKQLVASTRSASSPAHAAPPSPPAAAPAPAPVARDMPLSERGLRHEPPPPMIVDELDGAEELLEDEAEEIDEHEPPPELETADAPVYASDEDHAPQSEMVVDDADLVEAEIDGEDVAAQVAEILDEAASLRRRRMYPKAIEMLRLGVEIDPRSIDLRVALRDVLLESGRPDDAVDEMLVTASLQLDALDGESAARSLQDVLAIDPANERAIHTLRELGYDVAEPELPPESAVVQDAAPVDEPLPAYELEELGPADETDVAQPPLEPAPMEPVPAHLARGHLEMVDDPFGDEPLPSFPLDGEAPDLGPMESDANAFALVPTASQSDLADDEDREQHTRDVSPEEIARAVASSRYAGELEEALEEADFYASRGLFDDARAVLNDQISRAPNHPLLRERMEELEQQERAATQSSGTRAMPRHTGITGEDRAFDIAASLDALENLEEHTGPVDPMSQGQVDVEEVFAKFKEGVSQQISVDDVQSHYDLGIAYREIGKFEDAVRELEMASRAPERTCVCESMIGAIHMERGAVMDAIDAFLRGLHAPMRTPEQETVLSFELGAAYEHKKMFKDALTYYQRVVRREPNYRDVQERIRKLSKAVEPMQPMRAAAVGADDEFDRAFDEIIGSGKLP